jgi:hypothetical protein
MKQHNPLAFVLILAAGIVLVGCTVALDLERGQERLRVRVKPATQPADTALVDVDAQQHLAGGL